MPTVVFSDERRACARDELEELRNVTQEAEARCGLTAELARVDAIVPGALGGIAEHDRLLRDAMRGVDPAMARLQSRSWSIVEEEMRRIMCGSRTGSEVVDLIAVPGVRGLDAFATASDPDRSFLAVLSDARNRLPPETLAAIDELDRLKRLHGPLASTTTSLGWWPARDALLQLRGEFTGSLGGQEGVAQPTEGLMSVAGGQMCPDLQRIREDALAEATPRRSDASRALVIATRREGAGTPRRMITPDVDYFDPITAHNMRVTERERARESAKERLSAVLDRLSSAIDGMAAAQAKPEHSRHSEVATPSTNAGPPALIFQDQRDGTTVIGDERGTIGTVRNGTVEWAVHFVLHKLPKGVPHALHYVAVAMDKAYQDWTPANQLGVQRRVGEAPEPFLAGNERYAASTERPLRKRRKVAPYTGRPDEELRRVLPALVRKVGAGPNAQAWRDRWIHWTAETVMISAE